LRLSVAAFGVGVAICIAAAVAWTVGSRGTPPATLHAAEAASTDAETSITIQKRLDVDVKRIAAGLGAQLDILDEANAEESIHAALTAMLNRSMTPQIELARSRGYAAQRSESVINNMRRYHRTEGYFKKRPAPYDELSPDEWVRFINDATYEDLVNLYAMKAPTIASIDWANARVLTRQPDEPWIDSQREMIGILGALGIGEQKRSIGAGRSYYAPPSMTPTAFDPRGRPSVHLIVPMTTDSGEPLVCAYEFVVNERGGLDPFQFLRAQRVRDDRGETVPLLMPPF
jgi:hypothetical protein